MSTLASIFNQLHVIFDVPRPGALNMAIDQALLETSNTPTLRVYDWDEPTISVGYSHALPETEGLPFVRRWTGGGIVRHGRDATYALTVPFDHPWSRTRPLESYRQLHQALAGALNDFCCGPCRLASESDQKTSVLCFEAPALFDVLRSGKKIAGAGQRRGRTGVLHQGSVGLELTREFWLTFARALAGNVSIFDQPNPEVMTRADELVRTRYGTESWLQKTHDAGSASA